MYWNCKRAYTAPTQPINPRKSWCIRSRYLHAHWHGRPQRPTFASRIWEKNLDTTARKLENTLNIWERTFAYSLANWADLLHPLWTATPSLTFFHPSDTKIFELIRRGQPEKCDTYICKMIYDISTACEYCRLYSKTPFSFRESVSPEDHFQIGISHRPIAAKQPPSPPHRLYAQKLPERGEFALKTSG